MNEYKVTYFFDKEHYIRRFIFLGSLEEAEKLIQSERDQYISFRDSRGIYHELNTGNVRVVQVSQYFRKEKKKK